MLEIVTGRTGSGKTALCLERIEEKLLGEPAGQKIILLLPEHMTYRVERQLASLLAKKGRGFSSCYIYGFRRFAYQVLQETGGALEPGLTELGRHLLLKKLLDKRLADKDSQGLQAFAKAARQRGFVGELSDIINEMKSYCISPENLLQLSETIGEANSRLQGKLLDMASIYGDFNEAMAGRYNDGKDIMAKLVEKLPQSQLVKGAELWLDGFLFFNPLEKQILNQLFDLCSDVHVNLTMDTTGLQAGVPFDYLPREDIFYRSCQTRNYLLELAANKEMSVEEHFLTWGNRYGNPALKAMEAQWMNHHIRPWQPGYPDYQGPAQNIKIVEAAAPRLELEAMAAEIVRLVREKGCSWSDIGILLRDEDGYGFLTELVLQEYGIPFFNAAKRQGIKHPLAELIRSALAICISRQGWSYENVFRCLKTGFFKESCNLLSDELDELENYVLEFGIRGRKRWTQPEPWQYMRRYSLETEDIDEKERARAERADRCRLRVVKPLESLQKQLSQAGDLAGLAEAVYNFLMELQVPVQLERMSKEAELQGDLAGAREHQQLWTAVMELLDQIVELGEFSPQDRLLEFANVMEEGLDNMVISLIPPGLDYVSIGSFDQNSMENLTAIFIPGANAGTMPRRSSENVILSDGDRIHINQVQTDNEHLSIIGQENSFNEAWLLYKGFNEASSYLWISYALSDDEGNGREPAALLRWVRRLLPEVKLWQILQSDGFVAEGHQAVSGLGKALGRCRDLGAMEDKWYGVYNWLVQHSDQGLAHSLALLQQGLSSKRGDDALPADLSRKLFAPKGWLRGSVTRLERYNSCPFQYYVQYGLKLQERRISEFSNPELGTLLHGVLREFGQELKNQNRRWSDVSEAEQRQMCHEILHRLAPKLGNNVIFQRKQLEARLRRIENTAAFALQRLCAFDAVSQLHPEYFEEGFGSMAKDANQRALSLVYKLSSGNKLSLNGQIDRIDMTEDGRYFMVMDYKTGNAAINIMDVYYGIKLQLLTYLLVTKQFLSAQQGEEALPVGMLYYFLKQPRASLASHGESQQEVIDALEKKLLMPGWIVADKELVQLIDSTLSQPGAKSRFIHATMKKGGDLMANATYLRQPRELELLLEYVEELLQHTGRDILAGRIAPVPYRNREGHSTCEYCNYRAICGFDAQLEGFGYRRVVQQGDKEFMENIEAELSQQRGNQADKEEI